MKTTALLLLVMLCAPLAAKDWDTAPTLADPSGTTRVNVSNETQLQTAVSNLQSNQLIVLSAGTYNLTNTLILGNSGALSNVGIRGATGDADDVHLVGAGMANSSIQHGIWVGNVDGILIADLTIEQVYYHPIQLAGEKGCVNPHIYNCKLIDAGEQLLKGTASSYGNGCDNGVIEYCYLGYTTQGTSYTNGVDIHGGANWVIRNCRFDRVNTIGVSGIGPAVLMWNGSSNTTCEGCYFYNCETAIAFGLVDKTAPQTDHSGGIIRNNFIFVSSGQQGMDSPDAAIIVWDSPNTKVLNNTVFLNGAYSSAIEYRFNTTGAEIRNNLCDGIVLDRGGGTSGNTVANNVTNAQAGWFADASTGDLHLSASAPSSVVDAATVHSDVTDDYDGNARGSSPDLGAHEYTPANQPPVASASYSGTPNVGNTLTLDGTASSDPDSGPGTLTYAWTQVSGPGTSIGNAGSASATVTPTTVGSYTFRLTVDDGADSDSDDITIAVTDPALTISTSSWSMTVTDAGLPGVDSRQLTYAGTGTLTVSVASDQSWLAVSFDNGSGGNTLGAGASGTITATVASVSGLSKGTHTATITVSGDDGSTHQVQIAFELNYTDPAGNSGGNGGGGGCAADHCSAFILPLLLLGLSILQVTRRRFPNS